MKKLITYVITTCISFTLLCLFYAVLSLMGVTIPINGVAVLEFFAVTSAISLLQFIFDYLLPSDYEDSFIGTLGRLVCVFFPVFGMGGALFHWFPFNFVYVSIVVGMILLIYFGVIGILALKCQQDAKAINEAIQDKKVRQKTEVGNTGDE